MKKNSFIRPAIFVVAILVLAGLWFEIENREPERETQAVKLFYYNESLDKGACSENSVLPVQRSVPETSNSITNAINLLIRGELSQSERAQGFTTEFPNKNFHLLDTDLKNGVLTLHFSEVPGFTDGGSCRMSILWAQIRKTALQFPEVKEVRFTPETLFQP